MSVLAGGTAALIGVGVAFAAWTSTGTGTGTATAADMGVANLSISGASVSGLYPTGDEVSIVTVTNNNPYPVELDELVFVDAETETAGCNAGAVTAALADGEVADGDYIAPGGAVDNDFVVYMAADAADECKGATFTLNYSTSGHSVNAQ
jgi:hypothetical protein